MGEKRRKETLPLVFNIRLISQGSKEKKVHLVAGNVVTFSKPHITTLKASLNLVSQSFITWQNVRGRKMFSCVNGWDTYCDRAN